MESYRSTSRFPATVCGRECSQVHADCHCAGLYLALREVEGFRTAAAAAQRTASAARAELGTLRAEVLSGHRAAEELVF